MIVGQHSQGLNKLLQTGEMINTMLKGGLHGREPL